MSCCCSNPYKLSCGNTCDGFAIDYTAPADGVYMLVAPYLGWTRQISATVVAGDKLVFDVSDLPLMHLLQFQVLLDGAPLTFEDAEGTQYDCFELRVRPYGPKFQTVPLVVV